VEIVDTVSSCEICLQSRKMQSREPLLPLPPTTGAWSRVARDLFRVNSNGNPFTANYHSSDAEVSLSAETASAVVVRDTKVIFARHGIPETVITDNGPQSSIKEYRAKKWDFRHTTSSPGHPRLNGEVEGTVQTVKALLKKATKSGEDPYLTLLNLSACPARTGIQNKQSHS